jgi:subtilisin family serine protease
MKNKKLIGAFSLLLCLTILVTLKYLSPTGYALDSGTSMAAPHVAGVAALMLSKNPNLTPAQIKSYILNNVDKRAAFGDSISGGRLNAKKAVAAVPAPPSSGC